MMSENVRPKAVVYVCHNCIPAGERLPRQFDENGIQVDLVESPCGGKTDLQYLFHAIEGGKAGLFIVSCPPGKCQLAQGNYRASVRVHTIQRLLDEIGLEPERVELLHCASDDPPGHLEKTIREAVRRFGEIGDSPLNKVNEKVA